MPRWATEIKMNVISLIVFIDILASNTDVSFQSKEHWLQAMQHLIFVLNSQVWPLQPVSIGMKFKGILSALSQIWLIQGAIT